MSKQKSKMGREYFNEKTSTETINFLQTPQEQRLNECPHPTQKKPRKLKVGQETHHDMDQEQEQILNVSINHLKDSNTDKLSAVINQLIAKNKISAKNAFEVPMIHLNETSQFNSLTGDSNWKKISSTFDSNNKIYGYRVDATHNHTYKILELLTRKQNQNKNQKDEDWVREEPESNFINFEKQQLSGDQALFKHLQKQYKGINILKLQVFFSVNPILEKTKRIFDQQGLRGLLLNNIEIGSDLTLQLNCQTITQEPCFHHYETEDKEKITQQQFSEQPMRSENIFTKIYLICSMNDLLQREFQSQQVKKEEDEIEIIWRELTHLCREREIMPEVEVDNDKNYEQAMHYLSKPQPLQLQAKEQNQALQYKDTEAENKPLQVNDENAKQGQTEDQAPVQKEKAGQPEQLEQNTKAEIQNKQGNINQNQVEVTQSQNLPQQSTINQLSHTHSCNPPNSTLFEASNAVNLSDTSASTQKQLPIISEIRLSRKLPLLATDLFLREIQPDHDKDNTEGDAVSKWKNIDKKPRVKRQPKKQKQMIPDEIDFLQGSIVVDNKTKMTLLSVDKVRKLQFKKFMKNIHTEKLRQNNLYIDTSQYKLDFQIKTLLRQDQPFIQQASKDEYLVNQQLNMSSNAINNVSNFIDLVDENNAGQSKTVSIKYVKQKIQSFIFEEKINSFAQLYFKFVSLEGHITPALCFLTMLHLTNQHGFRLETQRDDIRLIDEKAVVLE